MRLILQALNGSCRNKSFPRKLLKKVKKNLVHIKKRMSFQGGFGSNSGFAQGFPQNSFSLPTVFPSGQQSPINGFRSQEQLGGLGRQGWEGLVASSTGPGVNAAQAAVNLDPLYHAQRESRGPGGNQELFRSDWQRAISNTTKQYGVNASQAAQMLDPYWLGRGEYVANTPGTQTGRRSGYQGFNRTFGTVNQLPPVGRMQSPTKLSMEYARQLTPQIAQIYGDRIRGLDREGYQALLSDVSREFNISAAQAAVALDPIIQSQKEASGLTPQQWNQMISQATQRYGVNASQAAQILDPYVQGKRERGTQYDVSNVSVGLTQQGFGGRNRYNVGYGGRTGYNGAYGAYGGYGGYGGSYNGAYGGSLGRYANQDLLAGTGLSKWTNAGERSGGLESGLGPLEGLRGAQSFRGGTPAESTDTVLSFDQATQLAAEQGARVPSPLTKRGQQGGNVVNEDLTAISRALGLQPTGVRNIDLEQIRQTVGAPANGGRTWG